jgi:AbrB family looped-hinge helix DNA binding protein
VIFVEFAIAKISTKGQIVIPRNLRKNIHPGDEFLIVRDNEKMILKNIKHVANDLNNELDFAKRVDKAWKEYEKGKFITKNKNDFLEELEKC